MFKKNTWIVGLLVALAIMFAGCVEPFVDEGGVETVVADLAALIADVDDGYIDDWGSVFAGTPFQKCGGPDFQVITDGGVKKLKIDNMTKTWGEGFDVYSNSNAADDIKGAGFKKGDVIKIKGSINPVGNGLKLTAGDGKPRFGGWISGATFDYEYELTADDVSAIKGASPFSLRVCYADPDGGARMGTIILEQLSVTGKRKAGEEEPPLDYSISGTGNYKVPASSGFNLYVDLNNAVIGQLTPAGDPAGSLFPKAKIEKPDPAVPTDKTGKLVVPFTTNLQTIFFAFTPEIKTLIVNAAKAGYKFQVTFDADVNTTGQVRWCLGADRTGSWNLSTPLVIQTFDSQKDVLCSLSGGTANANDLDGIVFQARDAGNALPFTVTFKSIKIELKPQGALTALTALTFNLNKPGAGRVADKTITGTNFTGLVTWFPELPRSGRFEKLQQYRAEVAIIPDPGFTTTVNPTVTVNYVGTATGTITNTYDGGTRVVKTIYFEPTKAINELLAGVLFRLTDWITGSTNGLGDPLVQAGGPSISITNSGTKSINLTNIANSWDGIDVELSKVDAGIEPDLWTVTISVSGKVTNVKNPADTGFIKIGGGAAPYAELARTAANLGENDTFTITATEIPANYLSQATGNNGGVIRITADQTKITGFQITEIVITNGGQRP